MICKSGCATCVNSLYCSTCVRGTYLNTANLCVADCGNGYYNDS